MALWLILSLCLFSQKEHVRSFHCWIFGGASKQNREFGGSCQGHAGSATNELNMGPGMGTSVWLQKSCPNTKGGGAAGDFVLNSLLLESIVVGVREQGTHPNVLARQYAYLTASELMVELNQVSSEGLINLRRASYCSAWRRTITRIVRQRN